VSRLTLRVGGFGRTPFPSFKDRGGTSWSKKFVRAFAIVALIAVGSTAPARAQLTETLGALTEDNAKGYLSPLPKALSATLNAGLFQSGYVKKNGFSLSLGVKVMGIEFSDDDRTYTPVDPPGFSSTAAVRPRPSSVALNSVAQPGQGGTTLYHPGGLDSDNFALAMPQLEIGTVMGTRAVVRWISLDVSDSDFGKFDVLGIGAQHSLSQYMSPEFPVDLALSARSGSEFQIDDDLIDAKSLHIDVTSEPSLLHLRALRRRGVRQARHGDQVRGHHQPDAHHARREVRFRDQCPFHGRTPGVARHPAFHAEANFAAETGVAAGFSIGH
jgi:hypothetical protein